LATPKDLFVTLKGSLAAMLWRFFQNDRLPFPIHGKPLACAYEFATARSTSLKAYVVANHTYDPRLYPLFPAAPQHVLLSTVSRYASLNTPCKSSKNLVYPRSNRRGD